MGEEKRKFLRFECLVPVDLIEVAGGEAERGDGTGEAVIEDVSREGLRMVFSVGLDLTPGANVDLKVQTPEDPGACTLSGAIIWSKEKDQKLEVGIKINRMDECIRNKLLDIGYARWLESRITEKKGKKP
jgi:hypothetical protein